MVDPRPEKVAVVDEVRERLADSSAAILTEYRGLKVKEMAALRRLLTPVGGEYKVYKNTLVRRAAQESGLDFLEPLLEGPTAIAFVAGDVSAVAMVLRDFARTSPSLVVKGGLVGRSFLDARSAAALADLPSRQVLLAQLAGAIAAPMQKFASLMKALPQSFAYGLSALVEQRRAEEPEQASAAADAGEEPAGGEDDAGEAPAAEGDAGAGDAGEAPAAEGDAGTGDAGEGEPEAPAAEADPTGDKA